MRILAFESKINVLEVMSVEADVTRIQRKDNYLG